ncbi:MAG: L,D-transpeptidase family protein [Clostridium sp.]|nr:L,D-transpeptidase family protein [Clostridium sp.]
MNYRKVCILIIALITIISITGCSDTSSTKKINSSSNYSTSKKDTKKVKKQVASSRAVLKEGDKGEDVKKVQKELKSYGYNVTADGDFGDETVYAVMDFQHRHGLTTNGIIQTNTLTDLKKKATSDLMYKPQAQSVLTSGDTSGVEGIVNNIDVNSYTNYYIYVSVQQQTVYIFNGSNRKWKLINEFPCASGTSGTPTVTGNFFVGNKGPQFVTPNGIICRYFTQISGNYLFHSVLFDKNGNIVDGTLGNDVSHGCVRLALENAKYIYDNVPIGTGIWIK